MKAEERHRLHQNELEEFAARVADGFERYGLTTLLALCVVGVIAAGSTWWIRSSAAKSAVAWTQLADARGAEDFAAVADKHPGTSAAQWSMLKRGELLLDTGIQLLFTDRETALSELKNAAEQFRSLLNSSPASPVLRERSLLGLARCEEATCDGDTTAALDAYRKLLTEFPESIYKDQAGRRIKSLETGGTKEFYAWFAKSNPKPPEPPRPRDGGLLDSGDLPPLPSETPASNPADGTAEPAADSKPAPADASATEKPAAEKPAAEKPATEKPAAEATAPEKPAAEPAAEPKSDSPPPAGEAGK